MPTFEKVNPTVEAIQYTGENQMEIQKFIRTQDSYITSYLGSLWLHSTDDTGNSSIELVIHPTAWVIKDTAGKLSVVSNTAFQRDYKVK